MNETVKAYVGDDLQAYKLRGAGAVVHSHSLNALLATLIDPTATEFTVTNLEMIKVQAMLNFALMLQWRLNLLSLAACVCSA